MIICVAIFLRLAIKTRRRNTFNEFPLFPPAFFFKNRLTDKMNLSIIFRVVNIIVAAFMIIGGVMTCIAGGNIRKKLIR